MKKMVLFYLVFILTFVWSVPVLAAPIDDIKNQKNTIDSRINDVNKQKRSVQSNLNSKLSEKNKISSAQKEQDKKYKELMNEIKTINDNVQSLDESIKESEERLEKQEELLKIRIRAMYESYDDSYFDVLSESKDVGDFLGKTDLMSIIAKKDKELIQAFNDERKDIEYKKQEREKEKLRAQQRAGNTKTYIDGLKVSRAGVDDQIRKINQKLWQLEAQEDQLLEESSRLSAQIKNLQKGGTSYAGGNMVWPTPSCGSVSSYYGNRLHPILKTYRFHSGIDIGASYGASIVAANKGTVIMSGWQSGYGNTIVIDHGGGTTTLYAHCSSLLVRTGASVGAGDTIAKVGSTGLSTGPHLHFEVRKDGGTANPLDFVSPP